MSPLHNAFDICSPLDLVLDINALNVGSSSTTLLATPEPFMNEPILDLVVYEPMFDELLVVELLVVETLVVKTLAIKDYEEEEDKEDKTLVMSMMT